MLFMQNVLSERYRHLFLQANFQFPDSNWKAAVAIAQFWSFYFE